jgi:hypothetical protein
VPQANALIGIRPVAVCRIVGTPGDGHTHGCTEFLPATGCAAGVCELGQW